MGCFQGRLLLHLMGVVSWLFEAASEQDGHVFHEVSVYSGELLFHLLDLQRKLIDDIPCIEHLNGSTGAFCLTARLSVLLRLIEDGRAYHMLQ